jgi:hypothetical protein
LGGVQRVSQQSTSLLGPLITSTVALTVGILAYIFGRLQKEHEVRFTRLYERRAQTIAELYELLHDLLRRFRLWRRFHVQERQTKRDGQAEPIRETLNKFYRTYRGEDIWLTTSTWEELDSFYEEVDGQWMSAALPTGEERANEVAETVNGWVDGSLPLLIEELKTEFRETLGIRDESKEDSILGGWKRIAVGMSATSLIGLGVGGGLIGVFYKSMDYQLMDRWVVVLISSFIAGLGVGLLLEYLRPSRPRR